MAKRRMIDPAFWQSETMAMLNLEQRYLFIGLFSNADDQGRLRGHPALVRNVVFPFDDPKLDKIQADLDAIQAVEAIAMYRVDGKDYIQVVNWWEYQKPQWAYPSEYPAPEGWNDRQRWREDGTVKTYNWNGEIDDLEAENSGPEAENDDDSSNGIPKAIAKDLPNALPKATEIGVVIDTELDNIEDDNARMRVKAAIINSVFQNNISFGISPNMAQQMNGPPYFDYPLTWWFEAMRIADDNHVRKWSYVRAILDRAGETGLQPTKCKPGDNKNENHRNGARRQIQSSRKYADPEQNPDWNPFEQSANLPTV